MLHFKHLRLLSMAREWEKAVKRADNVETTVFTSLPYKRELIALMYPGTLNGDCFQYGCGDAGRKKVGGRTNLDKN